MRKPKIDKQEGGLRATSAVDLARLAVSQPTASTMTSTIDQALGQMPGLGGATVTNSIANYPRIPSVTDALYRPPGQMPGLGGATITDSFVNHPRIPSVTDALYRPPGQMPGLGGATITDSFVSYPSISSVTDALGSRAFVAPFSAPPLPPAIPNSSNNSSVSTNKIDAKNATAVKSAADLGKLVKSAREAKNLTQQEFADLAGVGRRFISELENGKSTIEFGKALLVATTAGIALVGWKR